MSDVIYQALRIATAEPCGPVYLALPRDAYHKEVDTVNNRTATGVGATPTSQVDVSVLGKAAEIVMNARDPLIMAGYTGRNSQSVASLVELAETLCARVLTADIGYVQSSFWEPSNRCAFLTRPWFFLPPASRKRDGGSGHSDPHRVHTA